MLARILKSLGIVGILGMCVFDRQDAASQPPAPPPVPAGVEVMARGPVHEAFATPTAQPQPTPPIPKKPPLPIEEMPPEEKPEGEVTWIGGYWAWDDDRNDYLWVSGCWRARPPGRDWVPGYWREQSERWQWVPGFWTVSAPAQAAGQPDPGKQVTYFPEPPAPPQAAPPGAAPNPDSFYVPGHWVWNGDRYAWRPGYWARVQPGYAWTPAHYRWTPYGYVFIGGYWDHAVARRGILYAPVVVNPVLVGPRFVYTPVYAVSDTIVLDTLFVRPVCCHYYFGDYYGPRYREIGFENCVVYSRSHYDSIVVYRSWEHRDNPRWGEVQITLFNDRYHGRAPVPPRTLAQQHTVINRTVINNTTIINNNVTNVRNVSNTQVLAPASQVAAAKGMKTVPMSPAVRQQAALQARTVQQAAVQQRRQAETPVPGAVLKAPRPAALNVPPSHPITPHPIAGAAPAQHPAGAQHPPTAAAGPAPQTAGHVPGPPATGQPLAGQHPNAPAAAAPHPPAPAVAPRPQARPAPPPARHPPDDRKKKKDN